MRRVGAASFILVSALVVAACGSGTKASSTAGGGSGSKNGSTATTLKLNADGTPNLTGVTLSLGNAAGSAHVGDTQVYDMVQFLKKWGANASQTNASQNAPELAVSSGRLDSVSGPLPTEVDSGLTVFGPNQARLDDVIVAKNSVASLSKIKGHSVAICCDASPDSVLLSAALKQANTSQSQLSLLRTGASTASLDALLAGKVDVAFSDSTGAATAGKGYHVLAVGATVLPSYADSFMAAQGSWLNSHPAMAEAIDLAWLASAKLFDTDQAAWVKAAATYTQNADTSSQLQQIWHNLQSIQGWPVSQSTFSSAVVNFNLGIARQQSSLKGQGNRPAAQEMDLDPWQKAWTVFSQHQQSY